MLRNLFKGDDKSHGESDAVDKQGNWFNRLKSGLAKTRDQFLSQLSGLLRVGRRIDEELMEEIEEILIQSDVGVDTTLTLMDNVRERVKAEGLSDSSELASVLKSEILNLLGEDVPLEIKDEKPYTILVLGVNGAGKTTTIGKLASRFTTSGHRVLVAAGIRSVRQRRISSVFGVSVLGQNSSGAAKMLNPPLSSSMQFTRRSIAMRMYSS